MRNTSMLEGITCKNSSWYFLTLRLEKMATMLLLHMTSTFMLLTQEKTNYGAIIPILSHCSLVMPYTNPIEWDTDSILI